MSILEVTYIPYLGYLWLSYEACLKYFAESSAQWLVLRGKDRTRFCVEPARTHNAEPSCSSLHTTRA